MADLDLKDDGKPDLGRLMTTSKLLNLLERTDENVERWLNVHEDRAQREAQQKKAEGREIDPDHLSAAIDETYRKEFFTVELPERNRLIGAYITAVKYWKAGAVTIASIGALTVAVYSFRALAQQARINAVASDVERAYVESTTLENAADALKKDITQRNASDLSQLANQAVALLQKNSPFFNQFCTEGTADEVTESNYREARQQLIVVQESLEDIISIVANGRERIQQLDRLKGMRTTLDMVLKEISSLNPAQQIMQRAQSSYNSGIVCVDAGELSKAQSHYNEMVSLRNDVKILATLPAEIEQAYQRVKDIAKESEQLSKADNTYSEAKKSLETIDIQRAKAGVEALAHQYVLLNRGYKIQIKADYHYGGETYSLFWRDWEEKDGRISGKKYFTIVEAIDKDKVIPLLIESKNAGSAVSQFWAQEITERKYNELANDKQADGIIDKNEVGIKERGYSVEKLNPGFGEARLLRWEEGAEMLKW